MSRITRRGFLRSGVAGGALLGLHAGVYRAALLAQEKPSERVRIGSIGVGNQGRPNMRAFGKNVVAVCEVDADRLAEAAAAVEKAGAKPQAFGDYRKMLEMKDLDGVCITTPDHWHALQTIHACQAGKDVYCEKPLTLVVAEGRAMVNAARQNNRIVQTGSQQRSAKEFRQACELVRNGAIGKVKTVKVGLPAPNWTDRAKGKGPVPDSDPPKNLDYDLWLGPAPQRPYNQNRVHYLFRFFWDYSGGQQTNFGAHDLDITQWALGADESGLATIEGSATFNKDKWFETPETAWLTYTYANGVTVLCSLGRGGYPGGCTFEGEKGSIHVRRGAITATPNEILLAPAGDVKLYVSSNHHQNWLDCVKTRKLPICDVEIGHRSATVCHLGNIAVRTGRKITWDAAKEQIVGDPEAAAMLSKPYRSPWKLG
jgi:predicted dehydrogenase